MNPDLQNALTQISLLTSRSLSANTNSSIIDLSVYQGKVKLLLDAGANTAGDAGDSVLSCALYDSADNSTFAAANIAFTNVTTAASLQSVAVDTRGVDRYLKAVFTKAGTNSPAWPVSLQAVGFKKITA